jgi:outer membrane protein TolC
MNAWLARAMAGAPLIDARREAAGAAAAEAGATASDRGPEIAALARYERNASDFSWGEGAYLVGLSVRWAAFDRGRASRISSAEARRLAAESSSRAAEDDVRLAVEQAFHEADTAARSVAICRDAVVAAASARDIAASRYAEGLLPLTDLLDVETELVNARYAEVGALYGSVIGRAHLALAAGVLEVPR